jgi:hypothetical protein
VGAIFDGELRAETIRHQVGLFRRIVGKARGQYQLPPIDLDLITLPAVDNEHAMTNRLNAERIAAVLPIIVEQFYAPMISALYTLGLRYCHVASMRCSKLSSDGVIAIEESYDVSANVFSPVDQRKKAPPAMALEPRALELVRGHHRHLMERNHPGLATGLVFLSEAGEGRDRMPSPTEPRGLAPGRCGRQGGRPSRRHLPGPPGCRGRKVFAGPTHAPGIARSSAPHSLTVVCQCGIAERTLREPVRADAHAGTPAGDPPRHQAHVP